MQKSGIKSQSKRLVEGLDEKGIVRFNRWMKSFPYSAALVGLCLLSVACKSEECDLAQRQLRGRPRQVVQRTVLVFEYQSASPNAAPTASRGKWMPREFIRTQALERLDHHLKAEGRVEVIDANGEVSASRPSHGLQYLEDRIFQSFGMIDPAKKDQLFSHPKRVMRSILELPDLPFPKGEVAKEPFSLQKIRWTPDESLGVGSLEAQVWDVSQVPVRDVSSLGTQAALRTHEERKANEREVDWIHRSGSPRSRLNFVILGDGYTVSEKDRFLNESSRLAADLLNRSPYSDYRHLINVYRVWRPSRESGADCDDHTYSLRENNYGSSFPIACMNALFGTEVNDRFVYQFDPIQLKVDQWAVEEKGISVADEAYVLVNSPKYGGAAVFWANQTNATPWDTASHEIGHSLGRLGDEYTSKGDICHFYMGFADNLSFAQESREDVKWSQWIEDGVPIPTPRETRWQQATGLFQGGAGGCTRLLYRPNQMCKMRSSRQKFCPVCREAMILRFYDHFRLIEGPIVRTGNTLHAPVVSPLLKTRWKLNGEIVQETSTYQPFSLPNGTSRGSVEVSVFDERAPVRRDQCDLVATQDAQF